jgi:hypothetical protein
LRKTLYFIGVKIMKNAKSSLRQNKLIIFTEKVIMPLSFGYCLAFFLASLKV